MDAPRVWPAAAAGATRPCGFRTVFQRFRYGAQGRPADARGRERQAPRDVRRFAEVSAPPGARTAPEKRADARFGLQGRRSAPFSEVGDIDVPLVSDEM